MFKTWRLNRIPQRGNSHSIGNRDETWSFSKDKSFDTLEEAENHVIEQNILYAYSELRLHGESHDVVRKRCLEDVQYASYWACFLNVNKKKMRELIINQLKERKIIVQ